MRDGLLQGADKEEAVRLVERWHYAHSVPSGKSHYFHHQGAIVVFSIPANQFIGKYLLGYKANVWELSRLWAPNGHAPDLLTRAISRAVGWFRQQERGVEALVSYADPNVGHAGGIYRAASWVYTGVSSDGRYYVDVSGQVVARRKFHSGGGGGLTKAQIEAKGYRELKRPGKHRFARGLSAQAKRAIACRWTDHSLLVGSAT